MNILSAKLAKDLGAKKSIAIINKLSYRKLVSKEIDVVVFDIQDVGARFYTYISTLHYVLEACGEDKIKVVVLDRPNPNGHYIDGPILEKEFISFVGIIEIPIVHGRSSSQSKLMVEAQ